MSYRVGGPRFPVATFVGGPYDGQTRRVSEDAWGPIIVRVEERIDTGGLVCTTGRYDWGEGANRGKMFYWNPILEDPPRSVRTP